MSVVSLTETYEKNKDFIEMVQKESGEDLTKCYQCGKCSAGCPVAFAMDVRPNKVIRMVQLGFKDEILNSKTIWVCATCSTCTTRCPRGVDLAKLMDTLRVIAYREGKTERVKNEVLFHESFMGSLKRWGRVYELGLLGSLNFGSGKLLDNADLGMNMFTTGKIFKIILPPRIKGSKEIKRIAEAIERMEAEC